MAEVYLILCMYLLLSNRFSVGAGGGFILLLKNPSLSPQQTALTYLCMDMISGCIHSLFSERKTERKNITICDLYIDFSFHLIRFYHYHYM